jgi:hypothetical protein
LNGNGCSESLLRIELLTVFHRNPGLVCSCSFLAEATGRDMELVQEQAEKLLDLRILEAEEREGERRYRYLPPRLISRKGGNEAKAGETG